MCRYCDEEILERIQNYLQIITGHKECKYVTNL